MWQWLINHPWIIVIMGFVVVYFVLGLVFYIKYFVIRKEISTDFQEKYDGPPSRYTRFICALQDVTHWWYWMLWLYITRERDSITDCTSKPACVNCINQ